MWGMKDLVRGLDQLRRRTAGAAPPRIEIVSTIPGLDKVHPPVPARAVLPDWFTRMSAYLEGRKIYDVNDDRPRMSVRACPGIGDLMGLGWVIPAWTDYALDLSADGEEFTWQVPNPRFSLKTHPAEQLAGMPLDDDVLPLAVKLVNPWYVRTPPGWSCLVVAPFYHPEPRFTVLPGVVDTDTYHGCNVNTLWKRFTGSVVLEAATPLVQLIPFRRQELELEVRAGRPEDQLLVAEHDLRFNNSLKLRPGHYRRDRKARGR